MATTARLIPSILYNAASSYLTVSDESSAFTNTDSTTYATITNNNAATTSRYVYLRGFNFSSIPDDAIVSSIEIKIKASHSGGNTSTIYGYNDTTQVSAAGSTTALTTSATAKTFTNTTIAWDTLKGYRDNFGIRINCRRSNRSTTSYIYIYGAEIDVTYTVPVYHDVSVSGAEPSGTTTVLEGENFTARGYNYSSTPTVTDNNVDVTSQVTRVSSDSLAVYPSSNNNTSFTLTNISNAYHGADNSTYATLDLAGGTTGTIYFNFGAITLPTGATLQSVACSATLQFSRNGSSSGVTSSFQMYANTTAKGSANNWVTSATDVAKATYNLTMGTWSSSDLASPRLYITMTNNASSTHRYIYVYGATLTVTYSVSGYIYIYTVSNITADHTIVFTASTSGDPPVITVGAPSRTIISDETGYDQCVCTFTSDLALQQWEARATKSGTTPARGVGLLVESGTTLAAGANGTVTVDDEELTNGDGEYTIKVYGQSIGGVWSE